MTLFCHHWYPTTRVSLETVRTSFLVTIILIFPRMHHEVPLTRVRMINVENRTSAPLKVARTLAQNTIQCAKLDGSFSLYWMLPSVNWRTNFGKKTTLIIFTGVDEAWSWNDIWSSFLVLRLVFYKKGCSREKRSTSEEQNLNTSHMMWCDYGNRKILRWKIGCKRTLSATNKKNRKYSFPQKRKKSRSVPYTMCYSSKMLLEGVWHRALMRVDPWPRKATSRSPLSGR
jgi:hypothetical protein